MRKVGEVDAELIGGKIPGRSWPCVYALDEDGNIDFFVIMDGTLADSAGDLIAAANAALGAMGHAPQLVMGRDDATALRGGRAMLQLAADRMGMVQAAPMIAAGYPLLLAAYGDAIDQHTTLYPGAMDAVARLKARGIAVGICTNKPEGLAETLLTRLRLRAEFAALVGADAAHCAQGSEVFECGHPTAATLPVASAR